MKSLQPLAGLRVLDLSRVTPGLFCTMLLGDMGADVITVEAPAGGAGDSKLSGIPLFSADRSRLEGRNQFWRSRRSAVLDLKTAGGLDALMRLAARADVFVEGFRPGTCERLGIGYAALSGRNPGLVYCSITGYGQTGPMARQPGHDLNYLAEAGLLSALVRDAGPPGIPLNVVADVAAGGLLPAFAIMAALACRRQTGKGCHLDMSMYEGLLAMLAGAAAWEPDGSWGNGLLSGAAPFYDCYRTSDGGWLSVAALEPKFFRALCDSIGQSQLAEWQHREDRWPELRRRLTEIFATATLEEWVQRLSSTDTAVAPVRSVAEAFERARQLGLVEGAYKVGPLPRLPGCAPPRAIATEAGIHTSEVLAEAGFSPQEVRELLASGSAAQARTSDA